MMVQRLLRLARGFVGHAAALGGVTIMAINPPDKVADCVANPAS